VSYQTIASEDAPIEGTPSKVSPKRSADKSRENSPEQQHGRKKSLGTLALAVLTFYSVSGGPWGLENIVRAGGPFYALCGFSLMFVWAIPEALVTTEMAICMPEPAGSVAWVEAAFGPKYAFMKGWLSLLSGIADNSLYPILFLDCFLHLLVDDNGVSPLSDENSVGRYVFTTFLTLLLTYLNFRGLDVVGKVAIIICACSLAPFVVFCVIGSFKVETSRWLEGPPGGFDAINWRLLLNTFYWNINFWDSAGKSK